MSSARVVANSRYPTNIMKLVDAAIIKIIASSDGNRLRVWLRPL
jgi:hypothetical protein